MARTKRATTQHGDAAFRDDNPLARTKRATTQHGDAAVRDNNSTDVPGQTTTLWLTHVAVLAVRREGHHKRLPEARGTLAHVSQKWRCGECVEDRVGGRVEWKDEHGDPGVNLVEEKKGGGQRQRRV